MATKRGMCPYCRNRNYFIVNPEAMSCFCGTNMHQLSPLEAINTYNKYIDGLISKANETLEVVGNAELAYQEFADVIEIDNSITYAYLGRILCLIYMSNVRKAYIDDARLLLETAADEYFKKTGEYQMIIASLKKTVKVVEEYLSIVYSKLSLKSFFFDEKCLKLYLMRVRQVSEFENEILEAVTSIKKRYANEKVDFLLNFLDELITSKELLLNDDEHILVNGDHYKVTEIKPNGNVEISIIKNKKTDTSRLQRYRMSSLDSSNKQARYIKDEVFKDYTSIIRSRKVVGPWVIILYALAAFCGVSAYIFKNKPVVFYSATGTGALLFILATILLILFISWGIKIKKKNDRLGNLNKLSD